MIIIFKNSVALSSSTNDPFVDTETGFVFPHAIAEFSFHNKSQYGDGLGYELNYRSEDGILITVIVYDLGEQDIKDGINDPRVQQQMKQALDDVNRAVDLGVYRSAYLICDVKVLPPLFLRASYNIVRKDGVETRNHLFIRGQHQHFVEIRATGPPNRQIDEKIANFMDQLLMEIGSNKQIQQAR